METNLYKIVRFYSDGRKAKTIKRGVTLQEAQSHCSDPETSSRTTTKPNRYGKDVEWFDGYTNDGVSHD